MRSVATAKDFTSPGLMRPLGCVLQRKCGCGQHAAGGECEECEKKNREVQRKRGIGSESAGIPAVVHEVLRSPGQPLDTEARAFMEPRFGHDFSQVRVHTGPRAAESARAVNALAYRVGKNVVFGAGQYVPEAAAGRKLIAHELTHVVQQASLNAGGSLEIGPADDVYERDADSFAAALDSGSVTHAVRQGGPRISPRLQRLGANPTCTKAEADGIHQAIFDARGWLNKVIPKLEESPLQPAVLSALRRNFGSTYGVAENAALIAGRLKVGRRALGRIPFSCDTAGTTDLCKAQQCGWATVGSNAATICTNPPSTLSIAFPRAARCVLHESLHASLDFMTVDNYKETPGYPGTGTEPLLNPASYEHLVMELS